MAKSKQVLKMDTNGKKFAVVFRAENTDRPFWIYRYTWGLSKDGCWKERKNIEIKYSDIKSCMFYLATQF